MNVLALCAGVGGLELGVRIAEPAAHAVCYVEREAYAAAVLVARMEDGSLAPAPVWPDLATFDGRPWRGVVDLVTAGYPCQPESLAGTRRGEGDERWLWREVWRVIREVGPRHVFLENVSGHLSGTFGRVVGDMAASGWRVEWDCIPAAAVGAPHIRDRVFILAADPDHAGWKSDAERRQSARPGWTGVHGGCGVAADADCIVGDAGSGPARAECAGRAESFGDYWRRVEAPEPAIRRVDDGPANRVDRLRALGNGVVPQAAARAWRVLWDRMTEAA